MAAMMKPLAGAGLLLMLSGPIAAQTTSPSPSARDAAAAFQLDGMAPADAQAVPAPAPDTPAPAPGKYTLNTPIETLIADPAAKAVLDRDLPGLSDDENLAKFRALSLRALQPLTGGQLTDALLAKVGADLGDPDAGKPTPKTPARPDRKASNGR